MNTTETCRTCGASFTGSRAGTTVNCPPCRSRPSAPRRRALRSFRVFWTCGGQSGVAQLPALCGADAMDEVARRVLGSAEVLPTDWRATAEETF